MKVQVPSGPALHGARAGDFRRAHVRGSRLGGAPRIRARRSRARDRDRPARHELSVDRSRRSHAAQAGDHRRGLAARSRATPPAGPGQRPRRQAGSPAAKCRWHMRTRSTLPFSTNISVPPGTYIVRVAVMDSAGRVGSVDHRVDAREVSSGRSPRPGPCWFACRGPSGTPASRSIPSGRTNDWRSRSISRATRTLLRVMAVDFEIAATDDGPALLRPPAAISRTSREGTRSRRESPTCACCRPGRTSSAPRSRRGPSRSANCVARLPSLGRLAH